MEDTPRNDGGPLPSNIGPMIEPDPIEQILEAAGWPRGGCARLTGGRFILGDPPTTPPIPEELRPQAPEPRRPLPPSSPAYGPINRPPPGFFGCNCAACQGAEEPIYVCDLPGPTDDDLGPARLVAYGVIAGAMGAAGFVVGAAVLLLLR